MTDAQFAIVSQRLANIQAMQQDFIHNLRICGFVGLGLVVGTVFFYLLLKEILKRW